MLKDLFSSRSVATLLAIINWLSNGWFSVPAEVSDDFSVVQWISKSTGFDGPKVQPINSTTYDWWYFDLVSADTGHNESLESLVAVFYLSADTGFDALAAYWQLGFTSVDLVQVVASFKNGSVFQVLLNGSEANFFSNGNAESGIYTGETGDAYFKGKADLSAYTVKINAPELGIVGTLQLDSIAPPHYPHGPARKGENMQIAPHIGWANAIPDSNGKASFIINGEKWGFEGYGYHDKNWGDTTFSHTVNSWYWGHCRLGNYSVVWFDFITPSGENILSSYVAQDDKILVASDSGIKVRPFGNNSTYPPLLKTGAPTGFHVNVKIPEGKLSFNVTGERIVGGASAEFYTRWIGRAEGGLDGESDLTGTALYEQFALA